MVEHLQPARWLTLFPTLEASSTRRTLRPRTGPFDFFLPVRVPRRTFWTSLLSHVGQKRTGISLLGLLNRSPRSTTLPARNRAERKRYSGNRSFERKRIGTTVLPSRRWPSIFGPSAWLRHIQEDLWGKIQI